MRTIFTALALLSITATASAADLAACDETPPAVVKGRGELQSEVTGLPPEARRLLKKIIVECSVSPLGTQCKEATQTFELEYGDRFYAISMTASGWALLEGSHQLRSKMGHPPSYEETNTLVDYKNCLEEIYRAR